MLVNEMPELGKTEDDEDVIVVDAVDAKEGTEGLSPNPDNGASPEPHEGDQKGGDDQPSPERDKQAVKRTLRWKRSRR